MVAANEPEIDICELVWLSVRTVSVHIVRVIGELAAVSIVSCAARTVSRINGVLVDQQLWCWMVDAV